MSETIQKRAEAVCFQSGHDFSGPLKDECLRCRRVFSQKIESCGACADPTPGAVHRMGPECALCPRRVGVFAPDLEDAAITPIERAFLRELAAAHLKQWGEVVIWNPTPAERANVNLCAAARRVVEER